MPVVVMGEEQGEPFASLTSDSKNGGPEGLAAGFFYDTGGRGIPRFDNLFLIRALEQTHSVQLPMSVILSQISSTPFHIIPTVDNPTDAHKEAAEEIEHFFNGNFNPNKESFDHLLKVIVRDMLSIDAGVMELVPNDDDYLEEIYYRDGATFTKVWDEHGRLPAPDPDHDKESDPAFFQFSLSNIAGASNYRMAGVPGLNNYRSGDSAMDRLYLDFVRSYSFRSASPIPFTRDQIVWFEENPRSYSPYGRGRVQTVALLVEILLNEDITNLRYFTSNEVPEGIVNLIDANQTQVDRFRQYWKKEIRGQEHKVALIGGKVGWTAFRPSLVDLQFLQSQVWYNKLVWMIFGLSQNEVGDVGDVNRATAEEQSVTVWRKTTKPILELLQQNFNSEVLPFLEAYQRVGGELTFVFDITNPQVELIRREQERMDIASGLRTVNEIRLENGEKPLSWGDWPQSLVDMVSSRHPEWFLEELGVENPPSMLPSGGLFGFSSPVGDRKDEGIIDGEDGVESKKNVRIREYMALDILSVKESDGDGALRNESSQDYPPLVSQIQRLWQQLERVIEAELDRIRPMIEEAFPEERSGEKRVKTAIINIISILDTISLTGPVLRLLSEAYPDAVGASVLFYQNRVEDELKERMGDEYEPLAAFKVEDSSAVAFLREHAASNVTDMEDVVKDQIGTVLTDVVERGGNIADATKALDLAIPDISRNRAELIARTEIMESARVSSQALGDSTELIGGKKWDATRDSRTRDWHWAMNDTIIPKDQSFIVPQLGVKGQPKDYPRTTFLVGGDQPYNCRCDQQVVLADDLPSDLKTFKERFPEVCWIKTTDRMKQVSVDNGRGISLHRLLIETDHLYSRIEGAKSLGLSKQKYYDYLKLFGLA